MAPARLMAARFAVPGRNVGKRFVLEARRKRVLAAWDVRTTRERKLHPN